jgi:hypothetical protein
MNAEKNHPDAPDLWGKTAAALFLLAGIIHLVIVPHHWEHAPGHGIFMAASGIVEIAWAVVFYRRPVKAVAETGIMIAMALIVLWIITRIFRSPFGAGPEEIDLAGVVTKLLEGASIVLLARLLALLRHSLRRISQSILSLCLLGVLLGVGVYEVTRIWEPFLPGLAAPESQNLEEHGH